MKNNSTIYRVVVAKNRKLLRVIKRYRRFSAAQTKFNKIKSENQILFEKKFVNDKSIHKTHYELLLLESASLGRSPRTIQNELGQWVPEKVQGGWNIVAKCDWKVEETFHVYGLKKRLDVADVIQKIIVPRIEGFYQVVMVLNKLVIDNDKSLEMILCKNVADCRRLHDFLFDFAMKQRLHNFTFLGEANWMTRHLLYDRMQVHSGLKRGELFRTSTRS